MQFIPKSIKVTTEFVDKLTCVMTIVLLVTMDVTSLYIHHVSGVDASSKFLNDHRVTKISTDVLCSFISFILTHSNFIIDDHSYLQPSGTVMGTKMVPYFANLFMASIEQTLIDNSPLMPLFYVRFIDDIFMIWTHGSEELEQFTTRANSSHPSIKFTTEISSSNLTFLHVLISVTATGIKTSLYRKPTDRHTYLMYCGFHPHDIKSAIVFIQILRLKRICPDILDYEHEVKIPTQGVLSRGYLYKLISEHINRVSHITQTKTLTCNSNEKTNEKRITFITQFHPSIATLLKKVNKAWLNIHIDNCLSNALSNPIMLANKQSLNPQQLPTHSKSIFLQHSQPCRKPQCKNCSHFYTNAA